MHDLRGGYLKKRLLRIQVGFLLSEGPGNSREIPIEFSQRLQVEKELLLEALSGRLVLTRTKEGILIQGTLQVKHWRQCDRCLDEFEHAFDLSVAELFATAANENISAFRVDSNGEIDLAPLLREEVLIENSYRAVCREDCRGISSETGIKLTEQTEAQAGESLESAVNTTIDPRLAILEQLLK